MKAFALHFCCFFLFSLSIIQAQTPSWQWGVVLEGPEYERGETIATDAAGNVYIAGEFEEYMDFDPGEATHYLSSAGERDLYLLKLDPDGNFLWVKGLSNPNNIWVNDFYFDTAGDLIITGYFVGTLDFDPGPDVFNQTADPAANFILKLDDDGNFKSVKIINSTEGIYPEFFLLNAAEETYLAGTFEGTVDFDPGVEVYELTSNGYRDIFVAKLDAAGNLLWAKGMGGELYEDVIAATLDPQGEVLLTGEFSGTVDFDPGMDIYQLTTNGSWDFFVQKLSADGDFRWANAAGGPFIDRGTAITTDSSGNVYLAGIYSGDAVDFDPGSATHTLSTGEDVEDIFFLKLAPDGGLSLGKIPKCI